MNLDSPILQTLTTEFQKLKRMAERAFEQLADGDFFFRLNSQQNSICVIIKHLSGNMLSRWTDFLTTDGEKPDRNRECEFVEAPLPVPQLMEIWETGWARLFQTLSTLSDADLGRTIHIRAEPMTALAAIARQLSHYGYHVGQILLLAKHIRLSRGDSWDYLTVAPGQSEQFTRDTISKMAVTQPPA